MARDRTSPLSASLVAVCLVVLFTALTALYTYPAVRHLSGRVLGGGWDTPMFLWNTWWPGHAIAQGLSPLFTNQMYYPEGVGLAVNTHCLLPALIFAPLQGMLGLVAAFNLSIGLSFVLSGLGMYLLVREFCEDRRAAVVAATIFVFAPLRVSKIGFLNLIHTEFLVFFLWMLIRAGRRRSLGWAAAAGGAAACVAYTSYNHLVFALLLAAPATSWFWWRERKQKRGAGVLVRGALTVLVAAVLCLPLSLAFLQELRTEEISLALEGNASYDESVPLRRFLLPGPFSGAVDGVSYPARQASFLGYSVLALAALGIGTHRRRPAVIAFALLAAVSFVFALGPGLNLGPLATGADDRFPLPYRWLRDWPVLGQIRIAHRFGILTQLALSVLAAFGAASLLRTAGRRAGPVVLAGLLALPLWEYTTLPFAKLQRITEVPAVMDSIRSDPRLCSILEFPPGRRGYPVYSYFDTIHQKPTYLSGQLARTPARLVEAQRNSPLITALRIIVRQAATPPDIHQRAELMVREIQQNRIGWLAISFLERNSDERIRKPLPQKTLEALAATVERYLPVAEIAHETSFEEIERWQETTAEESDERMACLWRVYRLRLD